MPYPLDFTCWCVVLLLAGMIVSGNALVIVLVGLAWGILYATAIYRIRKEVQRESV